MVVLAALVLASGRPARPEPAWLDHSLAGYAMAYDDQHTPIAVYDPATKFFLVRDIVCDGASLTLVLTRDHKEVQQMGYAMPDSKSDDPEMQLHVKALPSLSTGKGVKIGDSTEKVLARLGHPTERRLDGNRDQFVVLDYKWTASGEDDRVYDQSYTFKGNKLIEVCFSWDPDRD